MMKGGKIAPLSLHNRMGRLGVPRRDKSCPLAPPALIQSPRFFDSCHRKLIIIIHRRSMNTKEGASRTHLYNDADKRRHRQLLRARRALSLFNDVPLRARTSVESQKGVIADQRCSVENQKGAIPPWTLYSNSVLLVRNGTSLNCNNDLLALN